MRGFSDAERERLRAAIIENGRELFARYGVKKTTIAELTAPLDIAPSTFYQFFESKEHLYLEVLRQEQAAIGTRIFKASFDAITDPTAAIRTFLWKVFEEMETNALVRQLLVEDERAGLKRSLPPDEIASVRDSAIEAIAEQLRPYQQAGQLRDDVTVVANVIHAATFLSLHEDEIGDAYPATKERFIDALSVGLTTPDGGIDGTD